MSKSSKPALSVLSKQKEEKKVEYLELIYDLIFVYIVGRNNSLLSHTEGGFIPGGVFFAYMLSTLAIIQIWNFSTFYINLYGRNSVRDHIFLCVNMYLLYHMADGITLVWQSSFYRYCVAWILILLNLGIQHIIELRNHPDEPDHCRQLKRKATVLFIEAALVGVHMLIFSQTGVSTAYVPILFGIVATSLSGRINAKVPVDFAHLTERAMLYVVFTFGEMIIVIASYFSGELTLNAIYFSLMAFLIVVGLFLTYGVMYNRIIDRERQTVGTGYMLIHVFLILALNNISVALEFMRDEEVALMPKTLFLSASFVAYFIFMFLLAIWSKKRCAFNLRFALTMIAVGVSFVLLMLLFSGMMYVNIAVTVLYVYGIFITLYLKSRQADAPSPARSLI